MIVLPQSVEARLHVRNLELRLVTQGWGALMKAVTNPQPFVGIFGSKEGGVLLRPSVRNITIMRLAIECRVLVHVCARIFL